MIAYPLIGLSLCATYLLLAPSVVNGDGLGYLHAAVSGARYPGHVLYVPLLRGLRALTAAGPRAVDGLLAARALSAASAALAVAALGATAERLWGGRRAGLVAAIGLAVSWGCWSEGSDVESYAPALAALCLTLYCLAHRRSGRLWPALAGAMAGVAMLMHVENLLFVLPAALTVEKRARPWLLGAAALVIGIAYAPLLSTEGARWLGGASHGLHYPLRAATPAIALYGACKALVYAPYPYEASWARVLGCFAVGVAALGALVYLARGVPWPFGRPMALAWIGLYGAVGCVYYASDAERWLFVLPLLWLLVAGNAARAPAAFAVAAALALVNFVLWMPAARDRSVRDRASRAAAHLADGDLVIGPGNGWDEYLGFYDGPRVTTWPLLYYAGALGGAEPLRAALGDAARRAPRVFVARFDDARDPMGWKELTQFGITPATAPSLLPPGRLLPVGDGLSQLVLGSAAE